MKVSKFIKALSHAGHILYIDAVELKGRKLNFQIFQEREKTVLHYYFPIQEKKKSPEKFDFGYINIRKHVFLQNVWYE